MTTPAAPILPESPPDTGFMPIPVRPLPILRGADGAQLSRDQILGDLTAIYIARGARPDLALVHANVFRRVAALLNEGVSAEGERDVFPFRLSFAGCAFVEERDATDGCIYYVDALRRSGPLLLGVRAFLPDGPPDTGKAVIS